jgi:gamma-glutamyl:cysteine ligase YbdK (ATP-grasp superfamily)
MHLGIEVEYWLIDDNGDLIPADDLIAACDSVDAEMAMPLLEVKTPPCDTIRNLIDSFTARLETVHETARAHDTRLVPLGTPGSTNQIPHRSNPRIDIQRAVLGDDLDYAGHCAGTHIHFEQVNVTDQLRTLTALDPAFALVNTTPYYQGRKIAACARPYIYRQLCYKSLPSHGQLWKYPDSVDDWRSRISTRFEIFISAASENGINPDTINSVFTPHDALWTPVCLRDDLGTVEWRTPDAAPPLQLCRLVADVAQLITDVNESGTHIHGTAGPTDTELTLPPFETIQTTVETAIKQGLAAQSVKRYLAQCSFNVESYSPLKTRINGPDTLDKDIARKLRLQSAKRLEHDLELLRDNSHSILDELHPT